VKVLLIEDDAMLAQGIRTALSQSSYAVDVVATAAEALRAAGPGSAGGGFDICVLDLGLPDGDGLELLRRMRAGGFACPVLILSARHKLDERIRGLDAGADDYLVKPFALGELEARLRALLRRAEDYMPRRLLGTLRFDPRSRRALAADTELDLTRRELAVLEILAQQPGKVVPKEALLDAVFPDDADVGSNALEVQVSRLRSKLRPACVTIRALRGLGYRMEECGGHEGKRA
jgi:DNA-binding response OmpR family regulator